MSVFHISKIKTNEIVTWFKIDSSHFEGHFVLAYLEHLHFYSFKKKCSSKKVWKWLSCENGQLYINNNNKEEWNKEKGCLTSWRHHFLKNEWVYWIKFFTFSLLGGFFFSVKWPIFDNSIIKGEILFFACHPDIFSGPHMATPMKEFWRRPCQVQILVSVKMRKNDGNLSFLQNGPGQRVHTSCVLC